MADMYDVYSLTKKFVTGPTKFKAYKKKQKKKNISIIYIMIHIDLYEHIHNSRFQYLEVSVLCRD